MSSYNIEKIKKLLNGKQQQSGGQGTDLKKIPFWKPEIGEHDVRFLPYESEDGLPFQEVLYYTSNEFTQDRVLAPRSFGMPDPVKDIFDDLRKKKDGWAVAKHLSPQAKYMAWVIVRSEEEKGPQLWEFNSDVRNEVLSKLAHKDNIDLDLFCPDKGYDFTVSVAQKKDNSGKPRVFVNQQGKSYPVKDIKLNVRRASSKLNATKAKTTEWVDGRPSMVDYFKRFLKSTDELVELVENYMERTTGKEPVVANLASSPSEKHNTGMNGNGTTKSHAPADKLAEAFSDLTEEGSF